MMSGIIKEDVEHFLNPGAVHRKASHATGFPGSPSKTVLSDALTRERFARGTSDFRLTEEFYWTD